MGESALPIEGKMRGSCLNTTCMSKCHNTFDSQDTMTYLNTRNVNTSRSSSYTNKHTKRREKSIKQFIEDNINISNKEKKSTWDKLNWYTNLILSLCIILSNKWSSNIWGSYLGRSMGTSHGWRNIMHWE